MNLKRPIVLTVDGYTGHHSYRLFKWCNENNVIFLVLYPNATHILQMCDVGIFGPMKKKYRELYQDWKIENPVGIYNEVQFVKVLKKVNDAVIKKDTIINGWRSTGLQPFNVENVKFDRIAIKQTEYNVSAEEEIVSDYPSGVFTAIAAPDNSSAKPVILNHEKVIFDVSLLDWPAPNRHENFVYDDENGSIEGMKSNTCIRYCLDLSWIIYVFRSA